MTTTTTNIIDEPKCDAWKSYNCNPITTACCDCVMNRIMQKWVTIQPQPDNSESDTQFFTL